MSNHSNNPGETLLRVAGLQTFFPVRGGLLGGTVGYVRAVDGVDLTVRRGRTLGLVGESGSGKTTVGRSILRLIEHQAGHAFFDGQDLFALSEAEMRSMRRRMQMIFQDPFSSLNPRMTVGGIVAEPLKVHTSLGRSDRRRRVGELLERVGLAAGYVSRYPHEFSGGQRQRIGVARALATNPDFIVCDEPVSALDVSIQAQILNLLSDLQQDLGLSYLFIAHNLAVVEHFAADVAVMYLGRIVERAPAGSLYARPTHPYTLSLLSAVPEPDPTRKKTHIPLPGEVPSPINPPPGCHFHPRCPLTRQVAADLPAGETVTITPERGETVRVVARCALEAPALRPLPDEPDHCHACLLRQ
ncbi:MAG: ATP-binding cassette domain-containing protein [Phycisphaerae bacterium]|nr:ATP-binding cassette domain-containing protein [Phycisphaerae bacterium]